MSLNDKKLDKLQKLLVVTEEDIATPDDLLKMTEALVGVIAKERDKILSKVEAERGETDDAISRALAALDEKERSLRTLIDQLARSVTDNAARASRSLTAELSRIERRIPTRTDLSGLEAEIRAIQAALVTVPTEITANPEAVRDALELLYEEPDKLSIEAIGYLRAELDELRARATGTAGGIVTGPRLLRYLADVNIEGIANGQSIVWNSTTSKFEAATPSGGGGAVSSVNAQTGVVVLDADDISDTATTNKYVTAAEKTKLSNLSGTNTGDQTSIVGITGTLAQFNTAITDANIIPEAGGTFTGDILVPDEAYDATAWNGSLEVPTKNAIRDKIESLTGGGIVRSVASVAVNTTAGASASTDYVYFVTATSTQTLPTAVGNTNRYTYKCVAGVCTIAAAGAETIDGSANIVVAVEDSVDLISNGTEFKVV